jgi:hypothetical protein
MIGKRFVVMTSIHGLNRVMEAYASREDWKLILVGDRKGPSEVRDDRIDFLDMQAQSRLGFDLHPLTPENHYARKNLGYLHAISLDPAVIAETDDDNFPKQSWGRDIVFDCPDLKFIEGSTFMNVYREFCREPVWPRGFPLDRINATHQPRVRRDAGRVGVWQFLADLHPDVDAIQRLVIGGDVVFDDDVEPFALSPHVYCPFNSQNTFWRREAFPLLYLPTTVSFRFTDILRGYVAQRVLWESDLLLGFGGATVRQDRNEHDLMLDFVDEVPMYTGVTSLVQQLEAMSLPPRPLEALARVYADLEKLGVVKPEELLGVAAWSHDLRQLGFE